MTSSSTFRDEFILQAREIFGDGNIPLHRPVFEGNEKQFLVDCIDSNFVSSVGAKVTEFEDEVSKFTGAKYAIATVNGTASLQVALQISGVGNGDEVITQALTFVATCNAIRFNGADPVFVDVDIDTMGMSPDALDKFLTEYAEMRDGQLWNKKSGRRIAACLPMHTFGHPCRIENIATICSKWSLPLVEDAAESLGSYVGDVHTGTFGQLATLSFNGNKIITTGGGGMILTNDESLAKRAKHLTTTAKEPHPYEFRHDEVGYNFRLPNLNAALGCAQMEKLSIMLDIKAEISQKYEDLCDRHSLHYFSAPQGTQPNYWLNAIALESRSDRDSFLEYTNSKGVMTRPVWQLMSSLRMFEGAQKDSLENSRWLEDRIVNLPSSVPEREFHRIRQ